MDDDLVADLPARDALADLPDDARGVRAADVLLLHRVGAKHLYRLAQPLPHVLVVLPASVTRTTTSQACGSGTSISSSVKASIGSPSRS